jgi:hypothetical protein
MIVNCNSCAYRWDYEGKKKVMVQCPDCRKYTPINGHGPAKRKD